ncbi:hypothetical protein H1D32_12605 [Anaerobacillus sp. CMMVII]|uniref:hypothetical protein n=1 Tax=Anaerobacillus sp. CMMVII TaxID=2755588 RepID=UPI0021C4DF91|nr:hypothetical protein [Anaerobacillus sp. CMMVII]
MQFGKVTYDTEKLLKLKASNTGVKLYVIGRLTIDENVPLQLAKETLLNIKVFGPCKADKELKDYYNL